MGTNKTQKISGFLAKFFLLVLTWSFSFQKYSVLLIFSILAVIGGANLADVVSFTPWTFP